MPSAAGRAADDFLPLKPVELLVLTMLSTGDRHGYGIRQSILDYTQGRVTVEAGNLYRHIRALEDEALVAHARTPRNEDERRIYYTLTPLGKRVLSAELQRLRSLVRYAEEHGIIARAHV